MNTRYKNHRRRVFNEWRNKVKQQLPDIVTKFYKIDKHIDYSIHKQLGSVIRDINNPYYGIQDESLNNLDDRQSLTSDIMLRILVEDLFKFVNSHYSV